MDCESGRIRTHAELKALSETELGKYIPIDIATATLKQRQEMQVSPHDSRSFLGKLRIVHKGRNRNKPCPCGSGYKFKKCCWNKVA